MHSKHAKTATKNEKKRFERITEIGCLACRKNGIENPGEANHIVDGMKRKGHSFSYCLCPWHHRGVTPNGISVKDATAVFGPSRYYDGRSFRKEFGSDEELLEYQNELLGKKS